MELFDQKALISLTIQAGSQTIRAFFDRDLHMATRVIPNYSLYGVQAQPGWKSLFDFEWIPQRSRPYNWIIRPHKHDALIQILYLITGKAEVLLDDVRVTAQAPCLVWIPAQTVHGFNFSDDVDGPAVTAAQRPLESLVSVANPELISMIRKPAVIPIRDASKHADSLIPLFLAIEREAKLPSVGKLTAGMALLTAVCIHRARLTNSDAAASQIITHSRRNTQLEKFRVLVDENFRKHLSVDEYANQIGITPGQLSRICREVMGVSSLDVINARLIHEAQRELVYTGNTIKQLAFFLGFTDETYFARFFRKHTGLRPSEFRRKALAGIRGADKTNDLNASETEAGVMCSLNS